MVEDVWVDVALVEVVTDQVDPTAKVTVQGTITVVITTSEFCTVSGR